jgi:hypothetical protein
LGVLSMKTNFGVCALISLGATHGIAGLTTKKVMLEAIGSRGRGISGGPTHAGHDEYGVSIFYARGRDIAWERSAR